MTKRSDRRKTAPYPTSSRPSFHLFCCVFKGVVAHYYYLQIFTCELVVRREVFKNVWG